MSKLYETVEDFSIAFPQAVEFMEKQSSIFWPAHEVHVENDIHNLKTECTETEQHGIKTVLKLFTLYEQIIGEDAWLGRYSRTFKRHELQAMAAMFGAIELAVHKPFYSKINDLLSVSDPEFYTSYKEDTILSARMSFINQMLNHKDDQLYLAAFAFLEGAVLFSSFAFIKHFQANGKNKLVNTVSGINFSMRDENLHCQAAAWTFRELCKDNPLDKLGQSIISDIAREVVYIEDQIISMIFNKGPIEGIAEEELKQFVLHRVDYVLGLLGLENEEADAGPIGKWFYDNANGYKMADFFITTNNEYLRRWNDDMFSF